MYIIVYSVYKIRDANLTDDLHIVTGKSPRKYVFNRKMLLYFVFITLTLLSHETPIELAPRLSCIVGTKEVFIFLTMKYLFEKIYIVILNVSMI